MSSKTLNNAKKAKADEFYTQYDTVAEEVECYGDYWRGKYVYCNCDNPRWSNFFKYFALNFNNLGLRKLVATHYTDAYGTNGQKSLFEKHSTDPTKCAYKIEINEFQDNSELKDHDSIIEHALKYGSNSITALKGSGSFQSSECTKILNECDVVVTNPPFSLFSPFIRTLLKSGKDYLIIGNLNAATYRDLFPSFKAGTMRFGRNLRKNGAEFRVPDHYEINTNAGWRIAEDGTKYAKLGFVRWFTNIKPAWYPNPLELTKSYNPESYPTYDNYDAINVDSVDDIPCDYYGVMGVPTTFLDKYNPNQFEILGIANNSDILNVRPTRMYKNSKLVNEDGTVIKSSSPNGSAVLLAKEKPTGNYYTADNVDGYLQMMYCRIMVRLKLHI